MHKVVSAAAIFFACGSAFAGSISTQSLNRELTTAEEAEVFAVAEGRAGNLKSSGDFELAAGFNTAKTGQFSSAQFAWANGTAAEFTIGYNGSVLSMTLGGQTVTWAVNGGDAATLYLRTRATIADASVNLSGLSLDGHSITDIVTPGPNGLGMLKIGGSELADGFALTGNAALSWGTNVPSNSKLAFQLKLAQGPLGAPPVDPIPSPAAVVGVPGLLACLGIRRRRR